MRAVFLCLVLIHHLEGDDLRFKIFSVIKFSQSIRALYLRPIPEIRDIPIRPLYEGEVFSKIRSGDLRFYLFVFDIQIEYIRSKIHAIQSLIRRHSKFTDEVDMITKLMYNLREQISLDVLIERIYQDIEKDRLEVFFENERMKERKKISYLD